jgi:quercetin dioxygenase-like cupin family protein
MPANPEPTKPGYTVKNIETVAVGKDVRARLYTLAPGEVIPWHSHTEISDEFFVLGGELTVETRTPDDRRIVGVGGRDRVTPGCVHQTSNHGTDDCRFLLIQGVGKYDWIKAAG